MSRAAIAAKSLPALADCSNLLRFERPAPHDFHAMAIKAFGQALFRLSVAGGDMNGKHVFSSGIFFDAHSGHTGHLEETRRVPSLDFSQLRFGSHDWKITAIQARVTPKAWSTSAMWLAMVWLADPANNRPTALFVCRSRISEPESPAALNDPWSATMMI